MAQFYYKAMDSTGRMTSGRMEAANSDDLELRLGRMGLDIVRSRPMRRRGPLLRGKPITRRDLVTFYFHLEQLSSAGVPLLEGLADLRDTMDHPRFREVIASMIESIEGGEPLSAAMSAFPGVFDNVMISLIQAGEASGELPRVFRNLTETLKWQDEQIAQTKKLFMYPSVVASVVLGVIFFLMIYLVPQLVGFIKSMGQELPAHTRALIAVSGFLVDYWWLVLTVPVVVVIAGVYLARVSPSIQLLLDGLKLRLWVLGPLYKKTLLARFSNYFALMYSTGITVLDCMQISERIVGNRALSTALSRASGQIADGASISAAFEFSGLFPPLVLRMLKVGENTGALDESLRNVSYFYTRDVQEAIGKLQTMIEPFMTLILGGVLAWVMFSVLGPIYDLITTIKI